MACFQGTDWQNLMSRFTMMGTSEISKLLSDEKRCRDGCEPPQVTLHRREQKIYPRFALSLLTSTNMVHPINRITNKFDHFNHKNSLSIYFKQPWILEEIGYSLSWAPFANEKYKKKLREHLGNELNIHPLPPPTPAAPLCLSEILTLKQL